MAKRYSLGVSFIMPNSVDTTGALIDHHLKTVGMLVNNAAICDAILFSTFKVISGCEHKIAHAIYFSSDALQTKKTIINRILNIMDDKSEIERINRIIAATEKSQNQRNELSHALLEASADGQTIVNHNPRRQSRAKKLITGPYLGSLLKLSAEAHLAAFLAFQELCQKRGIPPTISLE